MHNTLELNHNLWWKWICIQNWAQYLLCMQYLSKMTDNQTLVMYSGHPLGLFPSNKNAPRVVVTNGMVIPNYSKKIDLG